MQRYHPASAPAPRALLLFVTVSGLMRLEHISYQRTSAALYSPHSRSAPSAFPSSSSEHAPQHTALTLATLIRRSTCRSSPPLHIYSTFSPFFSFLSCFNSSFRGIFRSTRSLSDALGAFPWGVCRMPLGRCVHECLGPPTWDLAPAGACRRATHPPLPGLRRPRPFAGGGPQNLKGLRPLTENFLVFIFLFVTFDHFQSLSYFRRFKPLKKKGPPAHKKGPPAHAAGGRHRALKALGGWADAHHILAYTQKCSHSTQQCVSSINASSLRSFFQQRYPA